MNNKYYLKDKKAQIYEYKDLAEPGDMPQEYYISVSDFPLWCYASQLSQEIIYQAQSYGSNETKMFVFNAGTPAKVENYILYKNKWFQITRSDTKDDYNTDVFVYAAEVPAGDEPDESFIKPHGWTPEQG